MTTVFVAYRYAQFVILIFYSFVYFLLYELS